MAIYKNNKKVIGVYKGTTPVLNIYRGGKKVFGGEEPITKNNVLYYKSENGGRISVNNKDVTLPASDSINKVDLSKYAPISSLSFVNSNASYLDIRRLDMKNISNFNSMFNENTSLEEILIGEQDWTGATQMNRMFAFCENLKSVDFSQVKTYTNLAYFNSMFVDCFKLTSVTFGEDFVVNAASRFNYSFKNCNSLEYLDLSPFKLDGAWEMVEMCEYCTSLKEINISGFKPSSDFVDRNFENAFYQCLGLNKITCGSTFYQKAKDSELLFNDKSIDTSQINWVVIRDDDEL